MSKCLKCLKMSKMSKNEKYNNWNNWKLNEQQKKKEWTHKKKTHKRGIRRENKTQDIAIRDKEMENVKKWKKRQRVTIKWKTTYV